MPDLPDKSPDALERPWGNLQSPSDHSTTPIMSSCAPPFVRTKLNNKTKMFKSKMNGQNVSTESLPGFESNILVSKQN